MPKIGTIDVWSGKFLLGFCNRLWLRMLPTRCNRHHHIFSREFPTYIFICHILHLWILGRWSIPTYGSKVSYENVPCQSSRVYKLQITRDAFFIACSHGQIVLNSSVHSLLMTFLDSYCPCKDPFFLHKLHAQSDNKTIQYNQYTYVYCIHTMI